MYKNRLLNEKIRKGISAAFGSLYPFSTISVGLHELGHYFTLLATGGQGYIGFYDLSDAFIQPTKYPTRVAYAGVLAAGPATDIMAGLLLTYFGKKTRHDSLKTFFRFASVSQTLVSYLVNFIITSNSFLLNDGIKFASVLNLDPLLVQGLFLIPYAAVGFNAIRTATKENRQNDPMISTS